MEWSFPLRWHISTWEVPGFRAFWFQIFRLGILGQYFKGMLHGTSFSVLLLYVKHVFILPFFPTKHMVPCFLHNSKTLGRGRGSARVRYLPLFVSSVFLISSHHRILHKSGVSTLCSLQFGDAILPPCITMALVERGGQADLTIGSNSSLCSYSAPEVGIWLTWTGTNRVCPSWGCLYRIRDILMKLPKHKNVLFVKFLMEDGKQRRFALGPNVEQSLAGHSDRMDWEG